VAAPAGGIEVIDSRYEAFSFTLPDVIADNTSAARVAIGTEGVGSREADLTTLGCVFEVDGEITGTATGAALLGDPAECLAMLANHVGKHGLKLEAGWIGRGSHRRSPARSRNCGHRPLFAPRVGLDLGPGLASATGQHSHG